MAIFSPSADSDIVDVTRDLTTDIDKSCTVPVSLFLAFNHTLVVSDQIRPFTNGRYAVKIVIIATLCLPLAAGPPTCPTTESLNVAERPGPVQMKNAR